MLTFPGCAGWSLPKLHAGHFPSEGSHLERYAARFGAVEINSSFYRPHRFQTYEKWAASVPREFRFAVKIPRSITHEARLQGASESLDAFLEQVGGLGDKLGPLLVQLPPSLGFEKNVADAFFSNLRALFCGQIVCEPRHPSWFASVPDNLLSEWQVARVAADPVRATGAATPGGWDGLAYYRLHGSPTIYRSSYSPAFLEKLAGTLQANLGNSVPSWCIFDNTAEGAATTNALQLVELLHLSDS